MSVRRIVYLVTEDWYFCLHRLPTARAARDMGLEVVVATHLDSHREAIEAEGFRVVPWRLDRRSLDPRREIPALAEIVRLYRRERPGIVHHIGLKPIVYGTLAARLASVPAAINAFAGLGFVFTGSSMARRLLGAGAALALRPLLSAKDLLVLVENDDDRRELAARGLARPERTIVIPGSGVDTDRLAPLPEPDGPPVAALVGRMLWDKGVGEMAEAGRILRAQGCPVRLALVGKPDPMNPRSVPEPTLAEWQQAGRLEWWGHRSDVREVWREAAIAVLPSYREGMPMALLEAAACGRPLIAADVPGCREIVRDEQTGLLVPPRDPAALAAAIARLAAAPELRARLGAAARALAVEAFSATVVAAAVRRLYERALLQAQPG